MCRNRYLQGGIAKKKNNKYGRRLTGWLAGWLAGCRSGASSEETDFFSDTQPCGFTIVVLHPRLFQKSQLASTKWGGAFLSAVINLFLESDYIV